MSRRLSKKEAIALFSSAKELAKALGISKSAVSQWSDGPIPDNHDLRIRYVLKPEQFRLAPAEDAGTEAAGHPCPPSATGDSRQQRDL
ncbi:MAG TPA: Cro/CI family transcriptional regulator [Gammaproteobacteria bacterium]|jgi:DNA-binding transcriptional regulator YdaS (Cro superfamily)|nr:Cro/CI family transcriptional regulator [Gammaproteobacteria bacterium]